MKDEELMGLKKGDRVRVYFAFVKTPHSEEATVNSVSKIAPNGDVDSTPWVYCVRDNGTTFAICGTFVTEVISRAEVKEVA